LYSTALALIVLTMACVAHSAVLFARVQKWALALAFAVVLAASLNAMVALYQYFGFSHSHPIPYIEISEMGTAIGQVRQRNQMAILCMLGLVTLAYYPLQSRGWALARYVLGIVLIAAVAASASRIGAVAMLLFSCTLAVTFRGASASTRSLVGFAFPIFLLLAYLMPWLIEDNVGLFSRLADDAFAVPCNSRRLLWNNALSLIPQMPWVGAGWGGFLREYYMADLPSRGCELLDHAHNVYLQIAVEAGLPVLVLLIVTSAWFFVQYWRTVRTSDVYRWAYFCVAIIWLYAQTDFPLWETGFLWLFAAFVGICAAREGSVIRGISTQTLQRLAVPLSPRFICLLMLSAACVSAMALVQYFRVSSIATSEDWERQLAKRGYQQLVKENWMFADHLEFITAQLQRPTPASAPKINKFCASVLAYSPEPPIVMCLIRSAHLMGDKAQVEFHKSRLLTTYGKQVDMYKAELDALK
jgi:O-antigen polymerase